MADLNLLPCPFCGGAARIESNRDWHKLTGDHDDDCVFVDDPVLMVPATDDQLAALEADWNRRTASTEASAQPSPTLDEALADPGQVPYMIVFDDADVKPEIVVGAKRARYRYEQISTNWNAHLFVKVASNSRDCTLPSEPQGHVAPPFAAPAGQHGAWIAVSDKLPDEYESVLAYGAKRLEWAVMRHSVRDGWEIESCSDFHSAYEPKFWKPLPPRPDQIAARRCRAQGGNTFDKSSCAAPAEQASESVDNLEFATVLGELLQADRKRIKEGAAADPAWLVAKEALVAHINAWGRRAAAPSADNGEKSHAD